MRVFGEEGESHISSREEQLCLLFPTLGYLRILLFPTVVQNNKIVPDLLFKAFGQFIQLPYPCPG